MLEFHEGWKTTRGLYSALASVDGSPAGGLADRSHKGLQAQISYWLEHEAEWVEWYERQIH